MKKSLNKKNALWKWALLPLFILCTVVVLGILGTYIQPGREPLFLTPLLKDSQGWDIYTMTDGVYTDLSQQELLELEVDETFYLSRVMTEDLAGGEYTVLLLDRNRPASIFLDGELLYTTCPGTAQTIGQITFPPGYNPQPQVGEMVQCSLPAGSAGKTLTIATMHSTYANVPSIMLSSRAADSETWMVTANRNAMPAAAFAVSALLLLGLLCFSFFQGGRDVALLLLTTSALAHFFYYLQQYAFSSLTPTTMDTLWGTFLPSLMLALPALYLTMQMQRWRRPCMVVVLSATAISVLPCILLFFGITINLSSFQLALYVALLALFVCAVLEARDKNHVFQLFLGGLAVVCACVLLIGLCSAAQGGYYSKHLCTVVEHALDTPTLLMYWCGTVLFALGSVLGGYVLVRDTAATQTSLAMQTQRLERLDHDLAVQKQFYEAKLSNEEELRALRHDMHGHLGALSALLADGKVTEATRYLGELDKQHEQLCTETFCNDPYMNTVLSAFAARMRKNDVDFSCRCAVEGWNLPCVEVCLILNNALENALEATLLLPQQERWVKLQAAVRKRQLLFRISNRCNGIPEERDALPVSRKTEKGHGYGLKSIRSTAQRLGGEMMYRIHEDCFVLDVRIPLPENAEKGESGDVV